MVARQKPPSRGGLSLLLYETAKGRARREERRAELAIGAGLLLVAGGLLSILWFGRVV